ncbi:MAG: trypsin [Candidatus Magnetoglobus multicellularis str. Araruama]|uniref:Trypsin n=1 Tax=Candidatus Magnetoglobus multicellularis str. Araruama TaxID=890399 RepID=A0A1V1P323_9BACT|nr:MAG: trypsin [Candidatus Magnetoglobus multicellularis str. Araruama]
MKLKSILFVLILCLLMPCISNAASKSKKKQARIVGGTTALPGEFPWMAALVYNGNRPYNSFCGASLIHPKWVMTAGHCMEGETTNSFKVVVGLNNLKTEVGHVRTAKQIIVHPDYDNYSLFSDIAMIELSESVEGIQPISLYYDSVNIIGKSLTILGWGDLKENGSGSDVLMKVSIPIVSDTSCKAAYPDEIEEGMLCAGIEIGGKDSCQGDSGGPAIIWMDDQWKLIGLVSWGEGCARPGKYGVYTRIPDFFSFVFEVAPVMDGLFGKTLFLEKGWNLVSLPYLPLHSDLSQLFPDADSAYAYSNDAYIPASQLYPGKGYWVKVPAAKKYTIVGFETCMDIPLTNGWHLIGPTVSAINPVSKANAAIHQIYAFSDGQYYETDICPHGQACWVKIVTGKKSAGKKL